MLSVPQLVQGGYKMRAVSGDVANSRNLGDLLALLHGAANRLQANPACMLVGPTPARRRVVQCGQ